VKVSVGAAWAFTYLAATYQLLEFSNEYRWCPHLLDEAAPHMRECLLEREGQPKLLDSSDGIFSYFLDLPAQPGTGLTANAAGFKVLKERGLGSYHAALVRDGYVITTWSRLCDSGRVHPRFIESRIECGKHRGLEIYKLKPYE
jgi:hypothetical protein